MRRQRWLAWFASFLLVAALAVSGAHVHRGPANEAGCVACTLAHAPATVTDTAPAVRAPEPTREIVLEIPLARFAAPLCALHSSRAPPLG
jgi:hypothetical protein